MNVSRHLIIFLFFLHIAGNGFAGSKNAVTVITTLPIGQTTLCLGGTISVSYNIDSDADAGNIYSAQLSDASGSFANPVTIGNLTAVSAGTITAIIPTNTIVGTGYRIRVVSSLPVVIGSDNGTNLSVQNLMPQPNVLASFDIFFCTNTGGNLSSSVTNPGYTYQWYRNNITINGATLESYHVSIEGNYAVRVTSPDGCSRLSASYTALEKSAPQGSISVSGGTQLCPPGNGPSSISLFGNTSNGSWLLNGNFLSGSFGNGILVTVPGSYQWIPITLSGGCIGEASPPVVITTVTASFSGLAPNYLVTGAPVTLAGNPAGGTFSGPGVSGNTFDPSIAGVGGPYTISYSYTTDNFPPCTVISTQQTTVTQSCIPPTASISSNDPTNVCGGTSVLLFANTNTGQTYQWRLNNADLNGATSPTHLATQAGNYTVRITDASGCSAISSSVQVSFFPAPTGSFTGLGASYPANAFPVILTGIPAGGTFSGPGMSGNTFSPAALGPGGPYTITYTYVNANGCIGNVTHQTVVTPVGCAVPAIPGSISTAGDATLVCPGDVKNYSIAPVANAIFYNWTAPSGAEVTAGQGTTSVTITYLAGFTAGDSLRVTANNNCGSSLSRARKINRRAAPASPDAISGPVTGICNASNIVYATTQVPGLTYNWEWNSTGVSITSGQGTAAVTSDFTNTFITGKISVTATNNCGTSSPRNLLVNARPDAPGPITGNVGVCAGQQGVPYSIAPVANATSYIWYAPSTAHISDGVVTSAGSSLATTANNVQVNFSTSGGLIRVKSVNACTVGSISSLTVAVVCRSSNNELDMTREKQNGIFPNPSNGNFRMSIPMSQKIASAHVMIMNQFGQIVFQGNQSCSNGFIECNLAGKLANGMYMVSCVVDGEKIIRKLLINQ
ncbi:MAG TPA: T9SS type A sorting domain-containing protein [Ferruginibacter sp.]|mgnify:CR=1 FL=1|nr:T9SS type A sorting domain-containing protein [Ferruginibacter sp.]